jgi:hypothetical protein
MNGSSTHDGQTFAAQPCDAARGLRESDLLRARTRVTEGYEGLPTSVNRLRGLGPAKGGCVEHASTGLQPLSQRPVADPVAGTGAEPSSAVTRIGELAAVEREAAAADALGEPELEALELGDALVDPGRPCG